MAAIADRFKQLRLALGLTQEDFEERTDGEMKRTEVVKIENGGNQMTTLRIRTLAARAFGLSKDDLGAYLDGKIQLAETLDIARGLRRSQSEPPPAQWFSVDEKTKREALVILKEPDEHPSDEALEIAFRHLRISDPERAKNPLEVARDIRIAIYGLNATRPARTPSSRPHSR